MVAVAHWVTLAERGDTIGDGRSGGPHVLVVGVDGHTSRHPVCAIVVQGADLEGTTEMAVRELAEACELAFRVAKEGLDQEPSLEPPVSMRSYLWVPQLPVRAYSVALRAVNEDSEFRERVADQATVENVGRAGMLWLNRPLGWQSEFEELTGSSAEEGEIAVLGDPPPPPVSSRERAAANTIPPSPSPSAQPGRAESAPDEERIAIENELAQLRSLVDRLAEERKSVQQSVQQSVAAIDDEVTPDASEIGVEREQWEGELTEANSTIEALTAALEAGRERIAELEASEQAERDEAEHLRSERVSLEQEVQVRLDQLQVAERAREDLEAQLAEISTKWQQQSIELLDRSEDQGRLANRVNELEDEQRGFLVTIDDLQASLAAAQRDQDTGHRELNDARSHLAEARRSLDRANESVGNDIDQAVEVLDRHISGDHPSADPGRSASPEQAQPESAPPVPESVDDALAASDLEPPADGDVEATSDSRVTIEVPEELESDDLAVARHMASTADVVFMIDGEAAAKLGWPSLSVLDRRNALVGCLGELTAHAGTAADVIFEGAVGGEDSLPVTRSLLVRIVDESMPLGELFATKIDDYPLEWPIAVVTDSTSLRNAVRHLGVSFLSCDQLLDLLLELYPSDDV